MKRRSFLVGAAAAATGAGIVGAGWPNLRQLIEPGQVGRLLPSAAPLPSPYSVALPIPNRPPPVRTDASTDYYEIVQQRADLRILPGLTTSAWTYGGTFPGPTITSRAGRRTVVSHRNELPVPAVVHLHGGHTPHEHDGYPLDIIVPTSALSMPMHGMGADMAGNMVVGQRDYVYPMNQRAATLWYHDHRMDHTSEAVWRGLTGFHLVADDEEDALPLPRGHRDIPLMITDRSFTADGSFAYPHGPGDMLAGPYHGGLLGDVILVNGAPWPVLEVDPARYRLRLLNASNARRYRLTLDPQPPGGAALVQIGSDGGLLAQPVRHDSIDIAPAERFDVVIDFSRYKHGTQVRMVNRHGTGTPAQVMQFDVTGQSRSDDSAVPDRLSHSVTPLDPRRAAATRTFLFRQRGDGKWTINGLTYQPGRPLAQPKLGDLEIWRFITDFHHPIHVHLNHFQVLSRDGREPGQYDSGWKDTVDVRPAQAVEIGIRFTDYPGTYLLHCHNLEHEDMAMMGDFVTAATNSLP